MCLTVFGLWISIHAPLRERQQSCLIYDYNQQFQSTLPCGSDMYATDSPFIRFIFQSTLPCGSDNIKFLTIILNFSFQSTLPCGSDRENPVWCQIYKISIHAPLRERHIVYITNTNLYQFQSTLPCGSDFTVPLELSDYSISIHAPLRERPASNAALDDYLIISIHAPLRERLKRLMSFSQKSDFNPRSLAGATVIFVIIQFRAQHFNPRSLAGATLRALRFAGRGIISIHAPLRERQHQNDVLLQLCQPSFCCEQS